MAGRSAADLTPYVPRLLLSWADRYGESRHEVIEGTLAFADVSGFTKLSERLAKKGGKAGAEQMTDVVNSLFGDLLTVSATRGGEMLKYGGDAMLLFFRGDEHAPRAGAACVEMQQRLAEIGRVDTGAGIVRLRMSVGVHSGDFDVFVVGGRRAESHRELVVAGPAATTTVAMEAAAAAGEVLVSNATAALLPARCVGAAKDGGRLLTRHVPDVAAVPPVVRRADPAAATFVPPILREHLAAGVVDPEHRLVTVAFVHVMGLDSVLDAGGAAVAADALDTTVALVQESCADFGVSFLASDIAPDGTKVILAAGAPVAAEEQDARMVCALRRIVDAGPPLDVRAGIHRGHVFVGDVGPPFRRTFTTIGDVTNTAARVMGRAAPGEVLALEAVVDRLDGGFEVAQLDAFQAKGKTEPLVPYRIGTPIDAEADAAGATPATPAPLTGRAEELAALVSAARDAAEGSGRLIEVVGGVGLGKTRLVDELSAVVAMPRRTARCEPYERSTPFFAFRHLLAAILGVPGRGEDAAAALRERAAALVTADDDLTPWVPLLGDVLDLDIADTAETAVLAPQFRRQQTKLAVERALAAALTEPTVLVFEDVHWLDDASADLLRHLEGVVTAHPWLVVVTRRDEPGTFTGAGSSATITLRPLGDDGARALVTAMASAPLPPSRRDEVVRRAGGNPLFLGELVRAAGTGDGLTLPETVEAVLVTDVDALPADARKVLRVAAVLGSSFDVSLLAEVAAAWDAVDMPLTDARTIARKLHGVVVAEGRSRLRFRHQLLRDVAYEALPYRARRRLHDIAGGALERSLGGEAADSDRAGVLSLHFLHAQRWDECWRYARAAGVRAQRKYADAEAADLFERALSVVRQLAPAVDEVADVWEQLGVSLQVTGSLTKAADAYSRARSCSLDDPVRYARLCQRQAALAYSQGKPVASSRWIQRGLRVLGNADGPAPGSERADLLVLHAWVKDAHGRPAQALRLSMRAREEAERSGNRRAAANAYMVIDRAAVALGQPADPSRAMTALEIFEQLGTKLDAASLLNNLGATAYRQGRWADAASLYARGRDYNIEAGNLADAGVGTLNLAEVLLDQGRVDEAVAALDDLDQLFRALSHHIGLAVLAALRGRAALRSGDAARALAALGDAVATLERYGLVSVAAPAELDRVECLVRLARLPEASEALAALPVSAATHRLHAYLSSVQGDCAAAVASALSSLALADERGSPFDALLAIDALGAVAGEPLDVELAARRAAIALELGVVATSPPPVRAAAMT